MTTIQVPVGRSRLDAAQVSALLMQALFPLMVASFTLAQYRPMPLVMAAGQAASLASLLVALALLVTALPDSVWPFALSGILLVLRGARFAAVDSTLLLVAYTAVGACIFSAAGALIVSRRPGLLQRQITLLCAVSIPLMLLQTIGVPWTQILRTDLDPPELGFTQFRTLFVPAGQVVITTLQSRPAGLMASNNGMSLIVAFGLALYYGYLADDRLSRRDAIIVGAVVLLMAKITFLVLILMLLMRAAMGHHARRHAAATFGLALLFLLAYRILFPALFAANLSWAALTTNFQVRLADVLIASGVPALIALANMFPADILRSVNPAGAESGYSVLVREARTLLPTALVSIPYLWFALKIANRLELRLRRQVMTVAVTFVLAPLITSFLDTFMFWFLAGAALLPFWLLADPRFRATMPRVS